ncbi:MAG TPA: rod shape-determining protein MreD [Bryobacteraceae bacterium]|nr:rod shape-determining protein MreD [Bryobacteraceae bacterium]
MRYSDDHIILHNQRETQISRFKAWVLFLVPLAAILFQVYVPLFFQFLAYLELPLIVTIYFALMRRSPIGGLFVGALVGLAQDSLSKNPLGMFGITKTIIGYVAASVGLRLDVDHPLIRLILGFFFFVFHHFIFWALSRGLLGQQMNFETQRTLVLGLLNAIVAVSLFHFLDKLKERT